MNNRIIGIDVARALAIVGMILVNFKMVFGSLGDNWLAPVVTALEGKAAATFVVLAGVGIAFMTNKAFQNHDHQSLQKAKLRIFKRAIVLFFVGLSYIVIWPADILHFYGIYMLLTLLFVKAKPHVTLITAIVLIIGYPALMLNFAYDAGWNFITYEYLDFWTVAGFIRNLLYNGFHPVFPWTAFMLLGLWFGRQDLRNRLFLKTTLWVSLAIFVLMQFVSKGLIVLLSEGNTEVETELTPVLGTSPMPPLPLYMFSAGSMALVVICSCILWAHRFPKSIPIEVLTKTGQLALTFYIAHVIIGIGIVEVFNVKALGTFSLNFSIHYALIFCSFCFLFAIIWKHYKKSGPLEWLLRKLTD